MDHKILFDDTEVLSNTQNYLTRLHREAIEFHKHTNCFNKKEESLRVKNSWYHSLSVCKTKLGLYISKDLNISQLNCDQSGSSIQIQNTDQTTTFETQTNEHHAQQQGRGNGQLYNSRSPQTDCPQTTACLEKRAPATAVAQWLGGRRRTSRTSVDLESDSFPPTVVEQCRKDQS